MSSFPHNHIPRLQQHNVPKPVPHPLQHSTSVDQLLHHLSSLNDPPPSTVLPAQAMFPPGTQTVQLTPHTTPAKISSESPQTPSTELSSLSPATQPQVTQNNHDSPRITC